MNKLANDRHFSINEFYLVHLLGLIKFTFYQWSLWHSHSNSGRFKEAPRATSNRLWELPKSQVRRKSAPDLRPYHPLSHRQICPGIIYT